MDLAATVGGGEQPYKFYQALCEKLYRFAEWSFRNSRQLADGATEGEHRTSGDRQRAFFGIKSKVEATIPAPEFPQAVGYLWQWFNEIIRGISGNGYYYPAITWSELDSWVRVTRQEIAPREARTLILLGVLHANILSEKIKTDGGQG